MQIQSYNYPYPVLFNGTNDYIDCTFDIKFISVDTVSSEVVIEIYSELNCRSIAKLLDEGKAKLLINILCKGTSFRQNYEIGLGKEYLKIDKNKLAGKVLLRSYIVAVCSIEGYKAEDINPIYFSTNSISFEKGEKLAIGNTGSFVINSYDVLRPMASIFSIEISQQSDSIKIDTNEDKIKLFLNSELFGKYDSARNSEYKIYLSALFVIPAIVEVLMRMKEKEDDSLMQEKRWYQTITRQLKKKNIDLEKTDKSLFCIANDLLHNGLLSTLNCLQQAYDDYTKGEDKT